MKIACGTIIQDRNISENTENDFVATYKGQNISITTDHGHGNAKFDFLKRFDITVFNDQGYSVNTWEDHHYMKGAIRSALIGAMLMDGPK